MTSALIQFSFSSSPDCRKSIRFLMAQVSKWLCTEMVPGLLESLFRLKTNIENWFNSDQNIFPAREATNDGFLNDVTSNTKEVLLFRGHHVLGCGRKVEF